MAITHSFTATLPAPSATISDGFVFLLTTAWFTNADQGAAGSPIDGGANSIANGGGDMMAFSDTLCTTRLPIHVVTFVAGVSPDALVYVRAPSYTAGDTITIGLDDTQTTQPLVTAPYGRNAVYQDKECVFLGQTLEDASGNTTPTGNAVGGSTGVIGDAYSFNGSNQRIDFELPSSPTDKYTITGWANPPIGGVDGVIFGFGDKNVSNDQDRLRQSGLDVDVSTFNGSGVSIVGSATEGVWHKYTVSVDQLGTPQARLYIDGILVGTSTAPNPITAFNRLTLGVTADSTPIWWFGGLINTAIISFLPTSDSIEESEYLNQSAPDTFATIGEYAVFGGGPGAIITPFYFTNLLAS